MKTDKDRQEFEALRRELTLCTTNHQFSFKRDELSRILEAARLQPCPVCQKREEMNTEAFRNMLNQGPQ